MCEVALLSCRCSSISLDFPLEELSAQVGETMKLLSEERIVRTVSSGEMCQDSSTETLVLRRLVAVVLFRHF